jgi:hypothetical protein
MVDGGDADLSAAAESGDDLHGAVNGLEALLASSPVDDAAPPAGAFRPETQPVPKPEPVSGPASEPASEPALAALESKSVSEDVAKAWWRAMATRETMYNDAKYGKHKVRVVVNGDGLRLVEDKGKIRKPQELGAWRFEDELLEWKVVERRQSIISLGSSAKKRTLQLRTRSDGIVQIATADAAEVVTALHKANTAREAQRKQAAADLERQKRSELEVAAQARLVETKAPKNMRWEIGQHADVETEDGLERGAKILGPSVSGDAAEIRIQFADGTEDDWPVEDLTPSPMAQKEPSVSSEESSSDSGSEDDADDDEEDATVSFRAAVVNNDLAKARIAIRRGASVDCVGTDGLTALWSAASAGQLLLAKLLLETGASVDAACPRTAFTPLHAAAHAGHVALVSALLQAGATRDIPNKKGKTACDLAARKKYSQHCALDNFVLVAPAEIVY